AHSHLEWIPFLCDFVIVRSSTHESLDLEYSILGVVSSSLLSLFSHFLEHTAKVNDGRGDFVSLIIRHNFNLSR
ncbi:hypothetical protein PFISCL1PPCAC_23602, partial [Pristionchus fissidentatus]